MITSQSSDHQRLLRKKSREAISLAMESRWEEAVAVNETLLRLDPEDIEASNRLGKALSELGDWSGARAAFERSVALSPHNAIARKNLERLARMKEAPASGGRAKRLTPHLFVGESGKSTHVHLQDTPDTSVLAGVSAGTAIELRPADGRLGVYGLDGHCLGLLPPLVSRRLMRLMSGGNQYQAAVASVTGEQVSVVLRESYQHPSLRGVVSFPTAARFPAPAEGKLSHETEEEELARRFALDWRDDDEGVGGEEAMLLPQVTNRHSGDDDDEEEEVYPEEVEE